MLAKPGRQIEGYLLRAASSHLHILNCMAVNMTLEIIWPLFFTDEIWSTIVKELKTKCWHCMKLFYLILEKLC